MTSRVCVKGVPPHVTAKQLEGHFSSAGVVTDVKLLKNNAGRSRQMAFIGFKEDAEGKAAVHRFNKSFMGAARLSVELARPVLDVMQAPRKPRKGRPVMAAPVVEDDTSGDSSSDDEGEDSGDEGESKAAAKKAKKPLVVDAGETGRLFVRNLAYSATEGDLRKSFGKFGTLSDVHVVLDEAKRSKGFAYVTFMIPENAVAALAAMDGAIFQGRIIHVIPARPDKHTLAAETNDAPAKVYKAGKEAQRKKDAVEGKEESAWNPLFVRGDTALKALSEKYGVEDHDVMDTEASSLAVRVALGETRIIKETKQFLADEGVSVTALEAALRGSKVKRSTTCILVKNLPYTAGEPVIRDLFSRHGALARVVLPPARVVALVEFVEPRDAKRAFKALAYTRFERTPLYLEWAPTDVFAQSAPVAPAAAAPAASDAAAAGAGAAPRAGDAADGTEDPALLESNTVYVKNLNFSTNEDSLKALFKQCGKIRAVQIPRRKKKTKSGEQVMLSMGYGFVEFKHRESAIKAIKRLQSTKLDDHALQLKLSTKGLGDAASGKATSKRKAAGVAKPEDPKATKLLVKNLAFEATKRDLRELFGAFGQLKVVRIPRKFDGSHRGFGFVEFLTHQEAVNALTALGSSHLYGRHLVMEWAAKDENNVEDLREKAHAALSGDAKPGKKRRLDLDD